MTLLRAFLDLLTPAEVKHSRFRPDEPRTTEQDLRARQDASRTAFGFTEERK